MKKKIFSLFLVLALVFIFIGCGKNEKTEVKDPTVNTPTEVQTSTPLEVPTPVETPTSVETPTPSQHPTTPTEVTFTVTYVYDSDVTIDGDLVTECVAGASLTLPNASKVGYVFVGWATGADVEPVMSISNVESDLILSACFEIIHLDVTFNLDGGVVDTDLPSQVNYGTDLNLPTPVKEGYNFIGYSVNDSTELVTKLTNITNNISLVAKYEAKMFTIVYDLDGGTLDNLKTTVAYGTKVTPGIPVKEGFDFTGFNIGLSVLVFDFVVTSDMTVKATYTEKTFKVVYITNGVAINLPSTLKYNQVVELPTLEKTGYTFKGWTVDGEEVTSITGNKDHVCIALFDKIVITVDFELNGGKLLEEIKGVSYGGSLQLPLCYKQGNKFLGWTLKDSTEYITEIKDVTANVTLVAHFEEDSNVVLVGDGFYSSIDEAMEHVSDGGSITILPGTYTGGTISKSVTIVGANYGKNPNLEGREDESIFTSDVKVEANNVTIDGIALTLLGRIYINGNISNTTIKNLYVYESTLNARAEDSYTAPIYALGMNGNSVSNLVIDQAHYDLRTTGRPMILLGADIDGLTITNSEFLGGSVKTNYNDGIKICTSTDTGLAGSSGIKFGIRGDVNISNNLFSQYYQYVIWFRLYSNGNYVFENNHFESCGQTAANHAAITFINDACDSEGELNITFRYNKLIDSCMIARFDNLNNIAKVNINYNACSNCNGDYYIKNAKAQGTINADYNFFASSPVASKLLNVTSCENSYDSYTSVPAIGENEEISYSISYDLNGGSWAKNKYTINDTIDALLVALTEFYGKEITTSNLKDVSENASVKLYDFMDKTEWTWLRDYMIYCRSNDVSQSSGATYLKDKTSSYCNTYWRYEMQGFLNKQAWSSWPYSADYSSETFKDYFDTIAIYGLEESGDESYVYGVGVNLMIPMKEEYAFVGWFDEFGSKYENVGFSCNGDLSLIAKWAPATLPQEFILNTNLNNGIRLYDTLQLEWEFSPFDTYNQKVTFSSSNEKIFTVDKKGLITAISSGTAVLKIVVDADKSLNQEYSVTVFKPAHFEISYDTESYVAVDDTIKLNCDYLLENGSKAALIWINYDEDIASIENGVVTGLASGLAQFRAQLANDESVFVDFYVTVLPNNMSDVMKEIVASNNSNIFVSYNLGIGAGTPVYYMDIVQSVSQLLFNESLLIDTRYEATQAGVSSNHGGTKTSTEFICVHYTGNMAKSATASANANYFATGGGGTSIHYVTGNDGVYSVLDDTLVGYHAGDGTTTTFEWIPTGVKYSEGDPKYPVFGINSNSYFTINGKDTTYKVPTGTTAATKAVTNARYINDLGLAFKIVDGEYYMGTTWWCYSQVAEGRICNKGGNLNSIGIESAVNQGTDLWYTWHKTAQLVAKLMVDNNLDITRVVGHHFFSGKDCPQPLLENQNEIWWMFKDMVEHEYNLLSQFSDYTISMEVFDGVNTCNKYGRVSIPDESKVIAYKVTVTNNSTHESETITLASCVNGIYCK